MKLAELRAEVERRRYCDDGYLFYHEQLLLWSGHHPISLRKRLEQLKHIAVQASRDKSRNVIAFLPKGCDMWRIQTRWRDAHKAMAFLLRDALREGVTP